MNEEHWVDRVNAHVGAIPHKVRMTSEELVRDLDDMIRAQGEPFGSTSIYAQYRVFKLASENGITVTLDGQGADEMLAGYIGYPGQRIRSLLETGNLKELFEFWDNWAKWPGRSRMLAAKYFISEITNGQLYEVLRKIDGKPTVPDWINVGILLDKGVRLHKPRAKPISQINGRRVIDELALSLSKRGIASLLRHGDRNSMRFGIESRVPFLTIELAELLLSMPESYPISKDGQTKDFFRKAMRGIVPDDVLNRKDKVGFATDERNILHGMRDLITSKVKENLNMPFIKREKMINNILMEKSEKISSMQIWRWINFALWLNR